MNISGLSGLSELHRASLILLFALLAILGCQCMFHCIFTKRKKVRLPPGPLGLPLVGNLPFLGPKLHHRFDEYSQVYGPIVKLKLGSKLWIVISSPEIAKQVYKDNDIIFSNHDQPIAASVISYEGSNLVRSPYGPKWRMLRRVFLHELLNNKNLDTFSTRRQEEVDRMVRELYTKRSSPINVGEQAFAAFLNLLTSMLWGGTLEWEGNGAGFRQVVIEAVELLGRPNVSDFIPMLAWFDLCAQDIMVGGTSVTSSTVEWVMAELMHRPEIKQKTQEELERVVGQNHRVNESHIPKLHYLRAVIKESLRHHAVVPLLVPRVPSQTCVVGGYLIPEGARVVTNVWAIHMNPEVWENPTEFQPERFLNAKSIREFSFFPFGSGRRRCAGLPLVERMLPLVVATLLHAFEWRLPEGVEFDLCEQPGVTLTKARPVLAIPTPRIDISKLHNNC